MPPAPNSPNSVGALRTFRPCPGDDSRTPAPPPLGRAAGPARRALPSESLVGRPVRACLGLAPGQSPLQGLAFRSCHSLPAGGGLGGRGGRCTECYGVHAPTGVEPCSLVHRSGSLRLRLGSGSNPGVHQGLAGPPGSRAKGLFSKRISTTGMSGPNRHNHRAGCRPSFSEPWLFACFALPFWRRKPSRLGTVLPQRSCECLSCSRPNILSFPAPNLCC